MIRGTRRPLVFDLDGTLWDSIPWYAEILAREMELDPAELAVRLAADETVLELARCFGLSHSRLRQLLEAASERLPLYPGVPETLTALQARGVPLGLVTNLPRWIGEPLVSSFQLAHYFCAAAYDADKPQPGGLLSVLSSMGTGNPSQGWYVGDHPKDAGAAARVGVPFAWAAYGYGRRRPPGTAKVITSFPDVLLLSAAWLPGDGRLDDDGIVV